jgi:FMN phosphatase YigB (HAD superfamily)
VLTIVWDVDDVLNNLMFSWFHTAWLPAHYGCAVSYRDLTENPPHRVLGISQQEYLDSLDAFRLSDAASQMTPNPEVLEWFRARGAGFRHMALTARPLSTAPRLSEWLFRHFGAYIRAFGVVPTRRQNGEPVYDTNKAEFLEWLGKADVVVDDSPANLAAAQRLGIRGVLYPQPWNGSTLSVAATLQTLT